MPQCYNHPRMHIDFIATEVGFTDEGLGGASNANSDAAYHYILFGEQDDGVYFEYDDQSNGSVREIADVRICDDHVIFSLRDGKRVTVRCGASEADWATLLEGVASVFATR